MARETPKKTVPELVELLSSNLCVTSIGAAIFILMLNHADVIGDQSDAVTQNAWFRCALCAAISGEISILIQTGAESWGRFPVSRICRWESTDKHAPVKSLKVRENQLMPWINNNLRSEIRLRREKERKCKSNRSNFSYRALQAQKKHVNYTLRNARKVYRSESV